MEKKIIEAVIHKSKAARIIKLLSWLLLLVTIIALFVHWVDSYQCDGFSSYTPKVEYNYYTGKVDIVDSYTFIYYDEYYVNIFAYMFSTGMWSGFSYVCYSLLSVWIAGIIVGGKLKKKRNSCSLTVTTQRIFGNASGGNPVDFPIRQLMSVEKGVGDRIVLYTSNKEYVFWGIENQEAVYSALIRVLEIIYPSAPAPSAQYNPADELKKYKELLDDGTITQEEFDAKKKQLLNL